MAAEFVPCDCVGDSCCRSLLHNFPGVFCTKGPIGATGGSSAKELFRELKTPTVKKAKKVSKGDEVWNGKDWLVVTSIDDDPTYERDGRWVELYFDGAGISERYRSKTRLIVR